MDHIGDGDRASGWDEHSAGLEAADPVPWQRDRFEMPLDADTGDALYVCGGPLGPLPRRAREVLQRELDDWGRLGVAGYFREDAPWDRS